MNSASEQPRYPEALQRCTWLAEHRKRELVFIGHVAGNDLYLHPDYDGDGPHVFRVRTGALSHGTLESYADIENWDPVLTHVPREVLEFLAAYQSIIR